MAMDTGGACRRACRWGFYGRSAECGEPEWEVGLFAGFLFAGSALALGVRVYLEFCNN